MSIFELIASAMLSSERNVYPTQIRMDANKEINQ